MILNANGKKIVRERQILQGGTYEQKNIETLRFVMRWTA